MNHLQPRHKDALRRALDNAQGLEARYLREALRILNVDLSEPRSTKTKLTKRRSPYLAFMRPLTCSKALQVIVGTHPLPRTEVVSRLWAYIKKHNLQDPANIRMVNCDEALQNIFNKKQISMFEMAGAISKHIK